MLYSLGPVELRLVGLNPQKTQASSRFPFAAHEILGAGTTYEDMGDGEKRFSFNCVTFPNDDLFAGGMTAVGALEIARAAAVPLLLLRGDYTLMGFYLITELQEGGSTLGWDGVPGEVQLTIELVQAEAPFADTVFSLFGGVL